jgi:hypothetical protein
VKQAELDGKRILEEQGLSVNALRLYPKSETYQIPNSEIEFTVLPFNWQHLLRLDVQYIALFLPLSTKALPPELLQMTGNDIVHELKRSPQTQTDFGSLQLSSGGDLDSCHHIIHLRCADHYEERKLWDACLNCLDRKDGESIVFLPFSAISRERIDHLSSIAIISNIVEQYRKESKLSETRKIYMMIEDKNELDQAQRYFNYLGKRNVSPDVKKARSFRIEKVNKKYYQ